MYIQTFTYDLIDSKMYILLEVGSALVIDPNISKDAAKLLKLQRVEEIKVLITHEHYDHISGVEWLRNQFKCEVCCSQKCNQNMQSPLLNGSKYFKALFMDKEIEKVKEADKVGPITCCADVTFQEEKRFIWQGHEIIMTETPGHSSGSICILIDNKYLFTGDSLLKDTSVITRLPGGSKKEYEEITLPYLKNMKKDIYVYPGHGESGYIRDFKYVNSTYGLCCV